MGFHSDGTSGLVEGTGVAIVSLGHERTMTFRSKEVPSVNHFVDLTAGSLLYMGQDVQDLWVHAIPKSAQIGPRISLTWRCFRPKDPVLISTTAMG